ncbi:MAG: hypothetical protein AB8C46_15645 [Burkholderiaceae bacterium]
MQIFTKYLGMIVCNKVRFFIGVLGLAMLAAIAACGGSASEPTAADTPESETSPVDPDQSEPVTAEPDVIMKNDVQIIIDDMGLSNDGRLDGIPDFAWAINPLPAKLSMGSDPRGCFAPTWWQESERVRAEYKDCDYWTGFVQWFIAFEGVGNAADNVRIETRNPQSWYLSKRTGQWRQIGHADGTAWFFADKANLFYVEGEVSVSAGAGGSTLIDVDRGSPNVYHGIWPQGVIDIGDAVGDMRALFTTVQARLVVADPSRADDRDQAFWMLQSGADYYPYVGVTETDARPPGAGLSRSKRISSQWQSFNFATIDNARLDYRGPQVKIGLDELRQNPPPLNGSGPR